MNFCRRIRFHEKMPGFTLVLDVYLIFVYLIVFVPPAGAHTIGRTHCGLVNQRIYNFTGHGDADPSLNNGYVYQLKQECKPTDLTTAIPMDPYTPAVFDTQYYKSVSQHKGIFPSDAALLQGGLGGGGAYVSLYGASPNAFFRAFPNSIVKMGRIGVLTGQQGQIRKNCRVVN